MTSGIYSFNQIIEDIIIETGMTNLRNRHPEIRKLVARAEREISPFTGFLVKKKMLYYVGNGNFDGTNIKKPSDFVFTDKIGCCEDGLCDDAYMETISHIIICDKKVRTEIRFSYWGLQSDGQGNPVTSYNHADAVVAYCAWKLYSPKVFAGEGSLNVKMELEQQWENRCGEARGEDMFPDEMNMDNIYRMNSWSSLEMSKKTNYDRCISCDNCTPVTNDNPITTINDMKVYYWQLNNKHQDQNTVIPIVTPTFLEEQNNELFETFNTGFTIVNPYIGRLNIALMETDFVQYKIFDVLNNDVTDEFTAHYFQDTQIMLYTSKNAYSHSNINFKISL